MEPWGTQEVIAAVMIVTEKDLSVNKEANHFEGNTLLRKHLGMMSKRHVVES